jgi:DNA-binding SARP family transcriptional activator/tetratricopeptide (TPR) repeat protein
LAAKLEVQLFGEVRASRGDKAVQLGPPQQRAVFALLALSHGRLVSRDALVSALWGEDPPRHAANVIQTYVMQLRRSLEPDRVSRAPSEVLARSGDGYLLQVAVEDVDVLRFRRLVGDAREAHRSGHDDACCVAAQEALGLWQAAPAADLPVLAGHPLVTLLTDERWAAVVWFAEAALRRDTPGDALAIVEEGVAVRPLDEPLHGWLIRLYDALGRRVDALNCYELLRRRLVEELGVDPTPQLRELHQAVLRDEDPRPAPVTLSRTPAAPPRSSYQVPRQLPAAPQSFTGRVMELADLNKLHDASTVAIAAIDGMAGVGKTALALHAAHQMVDRYPDGQLFIDLHGYTDGVAPVEPGEALDRMLRALGVAGDRIPVDVDERAGLYRSRLANRRMVIVLDNAASESQVMPLLPGAFGCVVLITSRRRLVGLDHTHALSLDTMPQPDAIALLRHTADESQLAGQPPEILVELVELCGRLPLAIWIAAARLRSHPTWDLSHLTERLKDQQHRLIELAAGQRSVTAALDLSYHDLTSDLQCTYRLLGLHPGPDVDAYATAALVDASLLGADRMLEQLLDARLLQESVPGRYRFHDLTRAHAAQMATRDETERSRRTALDRLLDYYRDSTVAAVDVSYPFEREHRPQIPFASTHSPTLSDPISAAAWLDSELPNLLATAKYATEHDSPAHLLQLSTILHWHLRTHGRLHDAVTLHQQALTTARIINNQTGEIEALIGLGHVHRRRGQYAQAVDAYERGLRLAGTAGRQVAGLVALVGLGVIHLRQGRYGPAAEHFQQGLQLASATGYRAAEMDALVGLGYVHALQGRFERATDHYQGALQLARAIGHRSGELDALVGLGVMYRRQSRYEQATDNFQQALQLACAIGHRSGEQAALTGLGQIHRAQGRYDQATGYYRRLLDLARESGDRNWQFEAWQGLGRIQHSNDDPDAALSHHRRALALASELGQPDDQARAHDGLAYAYHALHQTMQAHTHWQHALDILSPLGVNYTEDEETTVAAIRAHLVNLGDDQAPKE